MSNKTELSWHRQIAENWQSRAAQQRLPHAVMLIGPRGVGKRSLATWMGAQKLELAHRSELPQHPVAQIEHADFRWIGIADDKKTIGIEQIRNLVQALNLTSYEGKGKVAIIEPANEMTPSAANSLLKTLEEPPGDALLILVADRTGKLPATIFSRCQRIDIGIPPEAESLVWLDRLQPGAPWRDALMAVAGAPIAAIDALDTLETTHALARDLNVLGNGHGSAIEVASNWAKHEPQYVLSWMAQQVSLAISALGAGHNAAAGLAIDDSVLRRMDRRNLFCYLDIINRLRGQPGGTYNVQLTFEGLLIDWTNGLRDCGLTQAIAGLELMRSK